MESDNRSLDHFYQTYGQLMIEQEILNAKINEVKTRIANELNKPKVEPKEPAKKE